MTTQFDSPAGQFSLRRVLAVVIPIVCLSAGAWWYLKVADERAKGGILEWPAQQFGLDNPTNNRLLNIYADANGDLVADRPDPAQCVTPDPLYFSYIPGDGPAQQADVWQSLVDAIAERTGQRVEFKSMESVADQLAALGNGELHITGINTGAVPQAVNASGFVPLFVLGNADGPFGHTMKFIVPQSSPLQQLQDVKGERVTFTSSNSNSGFKAPVVMLMYDYGLKVGRDYDFGFSTSHDESIRLVAEGEVTVAPVASDVLDRAISAGDIAPESIREIYSSERFPSATLGCAHNLDAQLAEKISQAILDFSVSGTGVQTALGLDFDARFVPVSYKDAWALIRRTDDALGVIHAPVGKATTGKPADHPAD